jgi:hypothetical protein
MKQNLADAPRVSFADALRLEVDRHVATAFSKDAAEAGRAFLEKRPPKFLGS